MHPLSPIVVKTSICRKLQQFIVSLPPGTNDEQLFCSYPRSCDGSGLTTLRKCEPGTLSPAGGIRLPVTGVFATPTRVGWVKGGEAGERSERTRDAVEHSGNAPAVTGRRGRFRRTLKGRSDRLQWEPVLWTTPDLSSISSPRLPGMVQRSFATFSGRGREIFPVRAIPLLRRSGFTFFGASFAVLTDWAVGRALFAVETGVLA